MAKNIWSKHLEEITGIYSSEAKKMAKKIKNLVKLNEELFQNDELEYISSELNESY